MVNLIIIYAPDGRIGFRIGDKMDNEAIVKKISVLFGKVTIFFSDGYKIIYKGLPYSIEKRG